MRWHPGRAHVPVPPDEATDPVISDCQVRTAKRRLLGGLIVVDAGLGGEAVSVLINRVEQVGL